MNNNNNNNNNGRKNRNSRAMRPSVVSSTTPSSSLEQRTRKTNGGDLMMVCIGLLCAIIYLLHRMSVARRSIEEAKKHMAKMENQEDENLKAAQNCLDNGIEELSVLEKAGQMLEEKDKRQPPPIVVEAEEDNSPPVVTKYSVEDD